MWISTQLESIPPIKGILYWCVLVVTIIAVVVLIVSFFLNKFIRIPKQKEEYENESDKIMSVVGKIRKTVES